MSNAPIVQQDPQSDMSRSALRECITLACTAPSCCSSLHDSCCTLIGRNFCSNKQSQHMHSRFSGFAIQMSLSSSSSSRVTMAWSLHESSRGEPHSGCPAAKRGEGLQESYIE